jgi:hypothetical protein
MTITVYTDGTARCLYSDEIKLGAIGPLDIRRASHVEPDDQGRWIADLSPVAGPQLGPFETRAEALTAEATWLDEHRI